MLSNVYMASPRFVQNLAISVYGAKTYRTRFGGSVPSCYQNLGSPFEPPTERELELQHQRLQALLKHCKKHVPYYRDLLAGVDVAEINSRNLAEFFPIISKSDLKSEPSKFLSGSAEQLKGRMTLSTSGSSGAPLTVYSSPEARRINYRFYERLLGEFGVGYRSKSTTIAGRRLFNNASRSVDRYDRFNNTQYLSAYSISDTHIEAYIDALNQWQPRFIDSYPSALLEIRRLAVEKGCVIDFKPQFILTSSETLMPHDRHSIESYFGAPIIDHYGCTEMTVSAFSRGGPYFSNPLYSVLELEDRGLGAYSLVSTGLVNFAMPLVRYDIGDLVSSRDKHNPYCIESVEGRMDDVIVTPEGRKIGRLGPAFKEISGIERIQVVQEVPNRLDVKVVLKDRQTKKFDERKLISNLKCYTSESMDVIVTYCGDIKRGANGKFKTVVSKMRF